jgi:hypothetical protein
MTSTGVPGPIQLLKLASSFVVMTDSNFFLLTFNVRRSTNR